MSFLDRALHPFGRRKGHTLPPDSGSSLGSVPLGVGLIAGEAVEDAIDATDDPAEQEREEFGTEL